MAVFVGVELLLAMAIPFLAIAGYHALLDSKAGRFVEALGPDDPGWRAVVEPSPLHALVETDGGALTGIVLLAGHIDDSTGGTVIVVPGTLVVEDQPLSARQPADAVAALGRTLRLQIGAHSELDGERWASVLGDGGYEVANPDPVVDDDGTTVLAVGPVRVDASNAAMFVGRPAPGSDPITLLFRRHLLWSAVLADPPSGDDEVADLIAEVGGPSAQVVDLPLVAVEPNPVVDPVAAEALIREVVPVPAGSEPGDRVQVRVIDRTGTADLPSIAAEVASTGAEVIEIGNAQEFDGGTTVLVVPAGLEDPALTDLALSLGAATVSDDETDSDPVVTLLIGVDVVGRQS